jgi:cell division protein FtsL
MRLNLPGEAMKRATAILRLKGVRAARPRRGLSVSLHTRGLVLWAAALVTGIVCVWEHVHSMELAARIEALRERKADLLAEIGFLRMECADLSSRERIEERAGEILGMRYPSDGEVVWLTPQGRRIWSKNDYVEAGRNDRSDG